ncbi:SDR family oxidoreductase [Neorhodopirellula lusitana]|uniref:SDR family oxidoreductase n=1 Tax=Neorhodopirellula lusitana TaxID=445327 RepID=UPI00384DA1D3
MNSKQRIGITGATGFLGGCIAQTLDERGIPTRLIVRSAEKAPLLRHADVAVSSYVDHDAMVAAVKGIDTLFFVSGFESADRLDQHKAAVDAFVAGGVQRVVYTSFVNCNAESIFTFARDHYQTEEYMRDKGLAFAALRDNFYSDMVPLLATDGVIRGPAQDGKFAPVARTDIADVAVALLTDPAFPTGPFDVTGPDLLTMAEAAAIVSDITGKPITFQNETVEEAFASRAKFNATPFEIEGWVSSYQAIAAGEFAVLSDTVERFTGRLPLTLREHLLRSSEVAEVSNKSSPIGL